MELLIMTCMGRTAEDNQQPRTYKRRPNIMLTLPIVGQRRATHTLEIKSRQVESVLHFTSVSHQTHLQHFDMPTF